MKAIDIQGKPYIEVNERLKQFRQIYQGYRLVSEIVQLDDKICVIRASIQDPAGNVVATGIAREVNGSTYINKTSFIENCETSAWGRALGNFGIGIDTSVASAEEVQNAINNQNGKPQQQAAKAAEPTEDVTAMIDQAFFNYQTEHADELPEGFAYDATKFKDELRQVYVILPSAKKKSFKWTSTNIAKLVKELDATKIITEVKAT